MNLFDFISFVEGRAFMLWVVCIVYLIFGFLYQELRAFDRHTLRTFIGVAANQLYGDIMDRLPSLLVMFTITLIFSVVEIHLILDGEESLVLIVGLASIILTGIHSILKTCMEAPVGIIDFSIKITILLVMTAIILAYSLLPLLFVVFSFFLGLLIAYFFKIIRGGVTKKNAGQNT